MLRAARQRGEGAEIDKILGPDKARRLEEELRAQQVRNLGASQNDNLSGSTGADDNILGGVEGNRPSFGPAEPEPGWTFREEGDLTEKDIRELEKALEEAARNN